MGLRAILLKIRLVAVLAPGLLVWAPQLMADNGHCPCVATAMNRLDFSQQCYQHREDTVEHLDCVRLETARDLLDCEKKFGYLNTIGTLESRLDDLIVIENTPGPEPGFRGLRHAKKLAGPEDPAKTRARVKESLLDADGKSRSAEKRAAGEAALAARQKAEDAAKALAERRRVIDRWEQPPKPAVRAATAVTAKRGIASVQPSAASTAEPEVAPPPPSLVDFGVSQPAPLPETKKAPEPRGSDALILK